MLVAGENNPNVGTSSTNWTPQLVGNFMVEAGGAEIEPCRLTIRHAPSGQWMCHHYVSTPGITYWLVTDGTFQRQFNLRGYADLFAEDFSFTDSTQRAGDSYFDSFQPV